eukprot:NODE_2653_length_333_cov_61.359223_g2643_i0.p3 GENE.NODE_2653_length_333_cov_61.359223_g2643_i0~~NODE_2653_length_333_cov_61.359223_g2643_i0.p3  ORF type:complete len:58 (-),score=8.95 NODE_2653_length_333_cov_61.359223_g2643_i0:4-177(-)
MPSDGRYYSECAACWYQRHLHALRLGSHHHVHSVLHSPLYKKDSPPSRLPSAPCTLR